MEKTRTKYEKEKTMTLFKQIALLVSLIIITLLGAVMYINYNASKKSMVDSLYETTVNNISTLTQKLSDASQDEALLIATIDAEFDSGYYRSIEYSSNESAFHYKQVDSDPIEGVPEWFVNNTTIEIDTVRADVPYGWGIVGEVKVLGDVGVVYKALYKMVINLLYLFVVIVFISLLVLSILLHFVLKPLKEIQKQAEAIVQNRFIIQEKEPYTAEFKDVVRGMNSMVKKVEDIFDKANESAKRNRELLYKDPVTKLYNRRYLMLKLQELIQIESGVDGGISMFVSLSSIESLNQTLGRQNAEKFLQKLSELFISVTAEYEDTLVARVNELDFALIIPACEEKGAYEIANTIDTNFALISQEKSLDNSVIFLSTGMFRYRSNATVADLLVKTDSSLTKAKADTEVSSYLYKDDDNKNALGKDQWRFIIEDALKNRGLKLKFYSAIDMKKRALDHKVMTFIIETSQQKKYFFGDFIAPAINFGLVSEMFLVAIKELLSQKEERLSGTTCSIRLSNEFMKDINSLDELTHIIKKDAKKLDFHLLFEVSNSFAIHNTELVKSFVTMFNRYNIGFGINAFAGESSDLSYLKELNPSFLKIDASYLLDQSVESMSALHLMTDSLGIEIIATYVRSEEEVQALERSDLHLLQGPVTDRLL